MKLLTKDKSFYLTFFKLTAIIAFQNIIVYSVNLVDNVMLGGYSETAMSGVALVNQIQFLLQMVILAIGDGVVIIASRFWGKKELDPIKDVLSIGVKCGFAIAAVLWVAVFFFPEQFLSLLSSNTAEVAEGCKYARIVCFSYFFFALTTVLLASLRSVESVGIGFIVSCVALVINVFLNYGLIYGNFGMPELGVYGAAWATLAARIAEFTVVTIYLIFFDKKIKVTLKAIFGFDKALFKPYAKVTAPMFLSSFFWGAAMFLQTSVLGHIDSGSKAISVIAANSIATTVFGVVSVFSYGSANATSVLIGKTIGAGKRNKLKEYSTTLQILFLGIGVIAGSILFFSRDALMSFYQVTDGTKELAKGFLTVLSITIVGTSYQVACFTGIIRGAGDTKFVLYNDLIFMWGIVLPASAAAAFLFKLPPIIVFCCLKSDQILKCLVAFVKVNRFKWINKIDKYVTIEGPDSSKE